MTIPNGSLIIEEDNSFVFYGIVVSEMVHWLRRIHKTSIDQTNMHDWWEPWKNPLQFYIERALENTKIWDTYYKLTFLPPTEQSEQCP